MIIAARNGQPEAFLPQFAAAVGVECINTVVLRRDVNNIVRYAVNRQLRDEQRLPIYVAINWIGKELLELRSGHVGRSQDVLGRIHIISLIAVAPGSDRLRGRQRSRDLDADRDLGTAAAFVELLNRKIGI